MLLDTWRPKLRLGELPNGAPVMGDVPITRLYEVLRKTPPKWAGQSQGPH